MSCDGGALGGVLFQHGDCAMAVHALDDGWAMRALAIEPSVVVPLLLSVTTTLWKV